MGEWLYECKIRDCHEHQPHEVHKCLMYFVKYAEKGFLNGGQHVVLLDSAAYAQYAQLTNRLRT